MSYNVDGGKRAYRSPMFNFFSKILPISHADAPERWRTAMGGADPATPFAEALINYHNHAVMYMIFVVFTVFHAVRK
ncbi:conserved Plasmodium protein, unknown function [Babesia microti strain RI]|uniref:Uncharacterized protein n=1 Tax=Babesia microti (strain RI) TaxID=1133968 RepID=A0A1N6LY99_BABMR|nr:conserved Plasmodium protein, unknown function [Babesia microti strain RI]SIO73845.1 conserved Plasmodium protein, unknown function [Babesia microti strain RI]|eukprot:XP_021337900.1 conserved Plasmodium protein, unknown function [Babesia microti strain RI]